MFSTDSDSENKKAKFFIDKPCFIFNTGPNFIDYNIKSVAVYMSILKKKSSPVLEGLPRDDKQQLS